MKKLNDKQKQLLKAKIKKVFKTIFKVFAYISCGLFWLIVIIALCSGSCSPKTKTASAYYYGGDRYFSMSSIQPNVGDTTYLYYYYDSNYNDTWVKYSDFVSSGVPNDGSYARLVFDTPYVVDSTSYSQLVCYGGIDGNGYGYYTISLYYPGLNNVDIVTTKSNHNVTVHNSSLLINVFDGSHKLKINTLNSSNIGFYRFCVWYFGEKGFNRIEYTFDIGVRNYLYTYATDDNTENIRYNGLMLKNENFNYPSSASLPCISNVVSIFTGSFRSGNQYYVGIDLVFTSYYGSIDDNLVYYYFSGTNNPNFVSNDEFLKGWFYLDNIRYVTSNGTYTIVWNNARLSSSTGGGGSAEPNNVYFDYFGWVGDSYNSTSAYRDLYIYNVFDSPNFQPFVDFPFWSTFSIPSYLVYVGNAYGSNGSNNGGVPNNTTPVVNIFTIMGSALGGLMPMFSYTIIPGFTIGTLIAVPFAVTILLFVIKLFKRQLCIFTICITSQLVSLMALPSQ